MRLIIIFTILVSVSCSKSGASGDTTSTSVIKEKSASFKCKDKDKAVENFRNTCIGTVTYNEQAGANNKPKDYPKIYCKCLIEKYVVQAVADEHCQFPNIWGNVFNKDAKSICDK